MKKPLRFFQETFYYPKWHFHEPHTIFLRSQYFDNLKKNHPFSYESAIDDLLMQSAYNTLTKSEAFSIFGHTTIFSYQKLNKWLRLQVNQSITTPIKNLLNGALLKMPVVPGNTNYYRGINLVGDELMNFINQHKQGHSIVYKEFVSVNNNQIHFMICLIEILKHMRLSYTERI
ncbi:MAG: hypothetical protein IPJ00_05185 [Saprospirales bacterium]|nr:hypothetical protein [Saprospirales bacterium]